MTYEMVQKLMASAAIERKDDQRRRRVEFRAGYGWVGLGRAENSRKSREEKLRAQER